MKFLLENENAISIIGYHGSSHKFDEFDLDKAGSNTDAGMYGKGIYFTDSIELAKQWNEHGYIYKCRLTFNNPFISKSTKDIDKYYDIVVEDDTLDINNLLKAGYDGLLSYDEEWKDPRNNEVVGYHNQYVCTDTSQIEILNIQEY